MTIELLGKVLNEYGFPMMALLLIGYGALRMSRWLRPWLEALMKALIKYFRRSAAATKRIGDRLVDVSNRLDLLHQTLQHKVEEDRRNETVDRHQMETLLRMASKHNGNGGSKATGDSAAASG